MEGGSPSAPGALARVRVMLSRSVLAEPAPSAPLAGTSRLHRRAAYTRCLRCAGAPRRPASGSGLSLPFRPDMPSSLTPGEFDIACVQLRDADAAFAEIRAARHSQHSRNPFHAGPGFRGFTGSRLLRPVRLLAPLDGLDQVSPAPGGFYIQASGGAVALSAAGYDYNSQWTPLLAGLSPAGMAASLAAPDLTGSPRPPGAFTSRLPTGRSPFPPLDMTTTATVRVMFWFCFVRNACAG